MLRMRLLGAQAPDVGKQAPIAKVLPSRSSSSWCRGTPPCIKIGYLRCSPSLLRRRIVVQAEEGSSNGNEEVDGWDPSLEIQVPSEQRPVNELAALKETSLYSWAELSNAQFSTRLGILWVLFLAFLGAPVAAASFEPTREPLKFILASGSGSLFIVALVVVRMYLGWSYVGDRLFSAVIFYEESGWYDGQLWVKPPKVLARDRLLGAYQVKPVMNRLKITLIGAATLLVTATATLVVLASNSKPEILTYTTPKSLQSPEKVVYREIDLLNPPSEVMTDDALAAAAASAAKGRPVYCTDRYYRALAGGQYCKWEDLQK